MLHHPLGACAHEVVALSFQPGEMSGDSPHACIVLHDWCDDDFASWFANRCILTNDDYVKIEVLKKLKHVLRNFFFIENHQHLMR